MFNVLLAMIVACSSLISWEEKSFTAQWALDRIDQQEHLMDGSTWDGAGLGEGITVYVVDNGVVPSSTYNFDASTGFSVFADGVEGCGSHHGSSIASLIGGNLHGPAWSANIVSVRVLDCEGYGKASDIVAGLQWILENADPDTSVVNMSIGGPKALNVDRWVNILSEEGFPVVVAAGNNGRNACNFSPARADYAITVGASNQYDMRVRSSNHGPCLNLYAPGKNVPAWHPELGEIYPSGSSVSAALVSGVIAAVASETGLTTTEAAEVVLLNVTDGAICCGYPKTPNNLLYYGPEMLDFVDEPWHDDWWSW
jgi:subtilisin family serine protease